MSEENKNIDQLFSDAAQAEKAPQYDSAYWKEMNTMLNARDAKKRAFLLWAFGGSAAFAVLLLSLFALNFDNSLAEQRYVSENNKLEIEKSEITNVENPTIQKNENVSHSAQKSGQLSSTEIKDSGINSKVEENSTQTENKIEFQKRNNQNYLKNGLNSKNNTPIIKEDLANSKNKIEKDDFVSATDEKSNSYKNQKALEKDIDITKEKINSGDIAQSKMYLPFTSTYKLTENRNGNISQSDIKLKAPSKYILYAQLNGGLMENYKTSRPYESELIDLSLNLEINMNNVLLRTGLGTQLTSNADLIVSQRKTINDITVINLQKDLSYQNLFDLYIPLELGYQLNNTSFGVGAQVNYLMTTSMDLNNYENKILVNTVRQYGNKDGLNSFSTQGYIWIEHKFSPLISLGLKTGTNISGRIKDGAYFNESATTNPIYGQLSLRVNLIK